VANKSYPNQSKPAKSESTIEDAFPASRAEVLLETIIDQNEEIVALLQEILDHKKPKKPAKTSNTTAPQESGK